MVKNLITYNVEFSGTAPTDIIEFKSQLHQRLVIAKAVFNEATQTITGTLNSDDREQTFLSEMMYQLDALSKLIPSVIISLNKTSSSIQANTLLQPIVKSRLYAVTGDNTNALGLTIGEWTQFSYPSEGFMPYRMVDFEIDPVLYRFTYTGESPKWFDIKATCNIIKAAGVGIARVVEMGWRLNGIQIGNTKQTTMSGNSAILTGCGQAYLSKGQYLEPWIRNIDNSDDCVIKFCDFTIIED